MMEVILREDVKSLGKAGQVVRVRPGYARNYLLPQGVAYPATPGNKKRIEAEARVRAGRLAAEKGDAEILGATLGAVHLTFARKAGEGDRLFGSITSQDIADALAGLGHPVDKRKIELDQPLKNLGEHTVTIRLHPEVHADIKVTVTPE